MKPVLEEALEQLRGQPKKPQPSSTVGLKDQLDPGKLVAESMRQALGFGGGKKIPTKEEIEEKTKQEGQKTQGEIAQIKESLGLETPKMGQPQQSKQQPKGNFSVINPPRTTQTQQPPAYISGKPGLKTPQEQMIDQEKKKKELPPLPVISTKPRRGSWLSSMERKKHGAEIKGGRE